MKGRLLTVDLGHMFALVRHPENIVWACKRSDGANPSYLHIAFYFKGLQPLVAICRKFTYSFSCILGNRLGCGMAICGRCVPMVVVA